MLVIVTVFLWQNKNQACIDYVCKNAVDLDGSEYRYNLAHLYALMYKNTMFTCVSASHIYGPSLVASLSVGIRIGVVGI